MIKGTGELVEVRMIRQKKNSGFFKIMEFKKNKTPQKLQGAPRKLHTPGPLMTNSTSARSPNKERGSAVCPRQFSCSADSILQYVRCPTTPAGSSPSDWAHMCLDGMQSICLSWPTAGVLMKTDVKEHLIFIFQLSLSVGKVFLHLKCCFSSWWTI